MTQLTIVPNFDRKVAKFDGVVAAGEKVSVVLKGASDRIADIATLRLRAVGFRGETLAQFPMPESNDAWSSDADTGDVSCELNLNTTQMLLAVPPAATMRILFVLDDAEHETLYFKSFAGVEHWPRKTGEEEPVDLGGYADFVEETRQALSDAGVAIEEARASAAGAANSSAKSAASAQLAQEAAVQSQGSAANSAVAAQEAQTAADDAARRSAQSEAGAAEAMRSAQAARTVAEAARDEAKGYAESAESVLANAATKDELAAEVNRAQAAENAIDNKVAGNTAAIKNLSSVHSSDLAQLNAKNAEQDTATATAQTTANTALAKANTLIGSDTGKSARMIAGEEVAKIVDSAPAAYDTLKEIADYITEDKTGAAAMAASIEANKTAIAGKVDKEAGKGLSTEDYTTEEKEKLGGIEAGAQKNPNLSQYAKTQDVIAVNVEQEFSEDQKNQASVNGGYRYRLYTPESTVDPDTGEICFTCEDRAINCILAETETPVRIFLPKKQDPGRVRDFIIKLQVVADTPPTVVFSGQDSEDIGWETSDDGWSELSFGINFFTFTETGGVI